MPSPGATVYDPPLFTESGLYRMVRRRWWLVLMPVVILVAGAAVLAFGRTPQYKAQSRNTVGQLDVGVQGIPGFITAANGLAAAYSRAANTDAVVDPVARRLGLPKDEVIDHVSASTITDTPVFFVEATADSEPKAVALVNAAADSLIRYIGRLNAQSSTVGKARARYRDISRRANVLSLQKDQAFRRYNANPSGANRRNVINISTQLDLARAEQSVQQSLLGAALQGQSAANLLSPLAPANRATSDRNSVAEILLLSALAGGLLIGLGLAAARSYNERQAALRRRFAR